MCAGFREDKQGYDERSSLYSRHEGKIDRFISAQEAYT
jgi:hypothetical protein